MKKVIVRIGGDGVSVATFMRNVSEIIWDYLGIPAVKWEWKISRNGDEISFELEDRFSVPDVIENLNRSLVRTYSDTNVEWGWTFYLGPTPSEDKTDNIPEHSRSDNQSETIETPKPLYSNGQLKLLHCIEGKNIGLDPVIFGQNIIEKVELYPLDVGDKNPASDIMKYKLGNERNLIDVLPQSAYQVLLERIAYLCETEFNTNYAYAVSVELANTQAKTTETTNIKTANMKTTNTGGRYFVGDNANELLIFNATRVSDREISSKNILITNSSNNKIALRKCLGNWATIRTDGLNYDANPMPLRFIGMYSPSRPSSAFYNVKAVEIYQLTAKNLPNDTTTCDALLSALNVETDFDECDLDFESLHRSLYTSLRNHEVQRSNPKNKLPRNKCGLIAVAITNTSQRFVVGKNMGQITIFNATNDRAGAEKCVRLTDIDGVCEYFVNPRKGCEIDINIA